MYINIHTYKKSDKGRMGKKQNKTKQKKKKQDKSEWKKKK